MNTPPVSYEAILTRINRFRVRDVLERCNEAANYASKLAIGDAFVRTPNPSRYGPVKNTVIVPWALAFLAKASLLRATDNRQAVLTDSAFADLLSLQANLDDAFNQEGVTEVESFLIRTAWEQFPYQEGQAALIPRTLMLLFDAHDLMSSAPIDVQKVWEEDIAHISLERFIKVGLSYLAGAASKTRIKRHFAASGIMHGQISPADCEAFLSMTSATYQEFRELSLPFQGDPLYAKTEFNILVQRPIISVGDELIVPVPLLLIQRITNGILYDFREHFEQGRRNPFSEYFGKLFEQYCGILLRSAFPAENVLPEPLYGSPERAGPDWIVVDGDCAILFECRSSGLSLKAKSIADQTQTYNDIKRIFLETARKYPQKIIDLQTGITGVDLSAVSEFLSVIVTYEPTYIEPIFRSVAAKELDEDAMKYLQIDIGDLEILVSIQGQFPAKSLLRRWREEYPSNPRDFGIFLSEVKKENGLDNRVPLLDNRMAEFTQEQFGVSYPPNKP
jgi:hypothetical protein